MTTTGFKRRAGLAAAAATVLLALGGCGGGGGGGNSDSASVRLVNATTTHPTLALLVDSDSVIDSVATNTASDYADVGSDNPTLQINDTATSSAVATLAPNFNKGDHYVLVAYESAGAVRTTIVTEETNEPTSGTAAMRVVDAAPEAGALDVYVTAPGVDISTSTSPTFTFSSGTTVQTSSFVSLVPGTYRVRVTGAGNTSDLRLDLASVTIASQDVVNFFVTPSTGGTLVNGQALVQQGTLTPAPNTSARVRLAAALTPGATATATVGGTTIASNVTSPGVTTYVLVPASGPVAVTVNGMAIAAPSGTLTAGSDATLFVYGNVGAATATLITDDNRLPSATGNLRMRLVNGIVGSSPPVLSLTADFQVVAANVNPGSFSGYATVPANDSIRLEITSPTTSLHVDNITSNLGNAVFTYFVLGDSSAPVFLLRRDR